MFKFNKGNILKSFLFLFLSTMLCSHNLIYFFISWVGLNISLYSILLGAGTIHNEKNVGPSETTLKYFVSGAMLTIFFLFSMVMFAVNYLTFDYNTLSYFYLINLDSFSNINLNLSEKTFYVTIVSLLLFKLGAFPFHFYIKDIYLILCPKNNMFTYTITLKVLIFLILINMISNFWFAAEIFYPVIAVSAIGSIISGAVGALSQQKLKGFLAYSYVNSLGFTLLGVSSGISYGFGAITFYSATVYFTSYILAWFIILLVLKENTIKASDVKQIYNYSINSTIISEFNSIVRFETCGGMANSIRLTSLVISLGSLLGLPPTLGFYAKALIYLGLVGSSFGQLLMLLALIFTPIMAYSYLRVLIKLIYPFIFKKHNSLNTRGLGGQLLLQIKTSGLNVKTYSNVTLILLTALVLVFTPVVILYTNIIF